MAKKIFASLILSLLFFGPYAVFAADLSFSPSGGEFNVGDKVVVKVQVSSDVPPNAVAASILFPSSILTIDSISKTGSIINFWVTEPTFSKSSGVVKLEGVVLNGFTGGSGTVVSVTFHAIKEGTAKILFQSGQVLANDGEGTDITKNLNSAQFTFNPTPLKAVPQISEPEAQPEVSQPAPVLTAPEIMQGAKYGEPAIVGNSDYPNSNVIITFVSETGAKIYITGITDVSGEFTLLVPRSLKHGTYTVTALVVEKDGANSPNSNQIIVTIGNIFSDVAWWLLLLIILLILAVLYLLIRGYYHLKKDIFQKKAAKKEIQDAKTILHKTFNVLREDVTTHVPTVNLKKDLDEAEKAVNKEINDI